MDVDKHLNTLTKLWRTYIYGCVGQETEYSRMSSFKEDLIMEDKCMEIHALVEQYTWYYCELFCRLAITIEHL